MTGLGTLGALLSLGERSTGHLTLHSRKLSAFLICFHRSNMVGLALVLPGGLFLTSWARQGLSRLSLSQALAPVSHWG